MQSSSSKKLTEIKALLISREQGEAIELLNVLNKNSHEAFISWLGTGSTVALKEISDPYKTWSIYAHRRDVMEVTNKVGKRIIKSGNTK